MAATIRQFPNSKKLTPEDYQAKQELEKASKAIVERLRSGQIEQAGKWDYDPTEPFQELPLKFLAPGVAVQQEARRVA